MYLQFNLMSYATADARTEKKNKKKNKVIVNGIVCIRRVWPKAMDAWLRFQQPLFLSIMRGERATLRTKKGRSDLVVLEN